MFIGVCSEVHIEYYKAKNEITFKKIMFSSGIRIKDLALRMAIMVRKLVLLDQSRMNGDP